MKSREELLKAPLAPNKQAAGIKVGAKAETVREMWGEPNEIEQVRPDFVRWVYDDVWFWVKAGKVDQIAVYNLYDGKTKEGIGLGSTRAEVEGAYGGLEWDGCWLINEPPFGIGFDFSNPMLGPKRVTGVYIFKE